MIFNLGGGAAAPQLTSIAVTTQPTTTVYAEDAAFDKAGMEVTAYFDDGSSEVIDAYTYSPQTVSLGATDITISCTLGEITKTATVTVEGRRYFYNLGDEFESITGGWVTAAQLLHSNSAGSTGAPTMTKNESNIVFTTQNEKQGIAYPTNSLDLTGVNTLVAEGSFRSDTNGNDSQLMLLVSTGTSWYAHYNVVASYSVPAKSTVTTISLNVASLSGKHYIRFWLGDVGRWTPSRIQLTSFYGKA